MLIKPSILVKEKKKKKNLGVRRNIYMTFETQVDYIYKKKVVDKLIYLNHITKNILHPDVQTSALWNNKLLFQYIQSTKIQKIRNLKGFAARVALGNINKYGHRIPYVNKLKFNRNVDMTHVYLFINS